jgi:iron(III) transport system ATP-binding protein
MRHQGAGARPRDPGAQAASPYLQVDHLWKRFGSFAALMDVSFDIFSGEFVCLLGPSGCGKTTLLRIIMGLEIQTSGRILHRGRDISALPPASRDFGIVFQSYALFPNLTVFDNVAYGLHSRKMKRPDIAGRVKDLLDLIGMTDAPQKFPAQLSGGQQQRVALARALAPSPSVLLLDEPLSALDAQLRVRLRQEIRSLQQRLGVTTILVTHDQDEALAMADRIVVMNQGVVEQIGTPIEIYRDPRTLFVANFVGEMNSLDGVLVDSGHVRVGTTELHCAPADGLPKGAAVRVCVRPEDVDIRHGVASPANTLPVKITGMEFLGSFYRLTLEPAMAETAVLRADIPIHLHGEIDLAPGNVIAVSLPADRIRVFARD